MFEVGKVSKKASPLSEMVGLLTKKGGLLIFEVSEATQKAGSAGKKVSLLGFEVEGGTSEVPSSYFFSAYKTNGVNRC